MSNSIRKCRFIACKHKDKRIDIDNEPFVKEGNRYYHQDCFELKKSNEWKTQKTRDDFVRFRDIWYNRISKTVNFQQLMQILNDYVARGVESEYLVFALEYVLDHNMNLNYPNGFKYYVDRNEIKRAYERHKAMRAKEQQKDFKPLIQDDSPKFTVKPKRTGFQSIINK